MYHCPVKVQLRLSGDNVIVVFANYCKTWEFEFFTCTTTYADPEQHNIGVAAG